MTKAFIKLAVVLLLYATVTAAAKNRTLSLPKGVQKFLERYRNARRQATTLLPSPVKVHQTLRREKSLRSAKPPSRPVSGDYEFVTKRESTDKKQRPFSAEYSIPETPVHQSSRGNARPVSAEVGVAVSNTRKTRPLSGEYGQELPRARIAKPVERKDVAPRAARPFSSDYSQPPKTRVTLQRSLTDSGDHGKNAYIAGNLPYNNGKTRELVRVHSYNDTPKRPVIGTLGEIYRGVGVRPRSRPISDRLKQNPFILHDNSQPEHLEGIEGAGASNAFDEIVKKMEALTRDLENESGQSVCEEEMKANARAYGGTNRYKPVVEEVKQSNCNCNACRKVSDWLNKNSNEFKL